MRKLDDCYRFIRAIAHRNPWDADVEIMLTLHENGKPVSTCKTLEFEPQAEGAHRLNPTFRLYGHEAQELMDMLWNCGVRPTEVGSAGQLAATERHLADMRRLVFEETP
jgi:hypothetical protein